MTQAVAVDTRFQTPWGTVLLTVIGPDNAQSERAVKHAVAAISGASPLGNGGEKADGALDWLVERVAGLERRMDAVEIASTLGNGVDEGVPAVVVDAVYGANRGAEFQAGIRAGLAGEGYPNIGAPVSIAWREGYEEGVVQRHAAPNPEGDRIVAAARAEVDLAEKVRAIEPDAGPKVYPRPGIYDDEDRRAAERAVVEARSVLAEALARRNALEGVK